MTALNPHLLLSLPVAVPLATLALCVLLQRQPVLQRAVSLIGSAGLLVASLLLLAAVLDGTVLATQFGDWAAPFGISFVADLFSAAMVVITGLMAVTVSVYALAGGAKERERALQETLVTAQRMSSDLKDRSKAEADLLVREARVKAERVLEQAQDQLHALENEIGRLRLEKDAFENRLRSAIEEHLSLLDLRKQEKADLDNLRFLRRRSTTDVG